RSRRIEKKRPSNFIIISSPPTPTPTCKTLCGPRRQSTYCTSIPRRRNPQERTNLARLIPLAARNHSVGSPNRCCSVLLSPNHPRRPLLEEIVAIGQRIPLGEGNLRTLPPPFCSCIAIYT